MTTRATLPENFYDWNSAKLLAQPTPEFPFASLFLSAIGSSLSVPGAYGLNGRQISGAGAAMPAFDKDALKLANSLPSGLWALGIDFKGTPGSTVKVNRPAFATTTYTRASRTLVSGQTISTTPITFGMEQTHLTLEKFAGPYGSGVQPFSLEAFDAEMGQNSTSSMVGEQLRYDFHRFLDAVHVEMTDISTNIVYPDGMSADNDATSAGSFPMTVEQLTRTEQLMKEANLASWPDGKRILFLSPKQWKELRHDPEYGANSSFHPEFNILFGRSYQGTVCGFHCFESNTLSRPNNSSSVPVHRAVAMAPGAFMGGMGRLPRVRTSTNDNYGETILAIWLADLAFGISDARFLYSVRSA